MATEILMPALSPTMEEGTLAKWLVKEGDTVSSGDIIAEIETDKATMEFEAVDEGTIGKILVAEGTEGVKVNTPIAVMLEEGEDADDIVASASAPAEAAPAAEAPAGDRVSRRNPCRASSPRPRHQYSRLAGRAEMVNHDRSRGARDAMAEEMRSDDRRLRHGRGSGRVSGRLQDHPEPAR